MPIRSLRLGLIGKADVVEFHKEGEIWKPFPVEYKHGKPKIEDCDRIQLCGQAMCLEEMLSTNIPKGTIFYGKIRRREEVLFDNDLKNETIKTAEEVHSLIEAGITPPPIYSKKCNQCSLVNLCLPKKRRTTLTYIKRTLLE